MTTTTTVTTTTTTTKTTTTTTTKTTSTTTATAATKVECGVKKAGTKIVGGVQTQVGFKLFDSDLKLSNL